MRGIEERDVYLSSPANRCVLESGLLHLEKPASKSHNLQQKGLMLDRARFVLDSIIDDYPSMGKCLASDAPVMRKMDSESAVIKLLLH